MRNYILIAVGILTSGCSTGPYAAVVNPAISIASRGALEVISPNNFDPDKCDPAAIFGKSYGGAKLKNGRVEYAINKALNSEIDEKVNWHVSDKCNGHVESFHDRNFRNSFECKSILIEANIDRQFMSEEYLYCKSDGKWLRNET